VQYKFLFQSNIILLMKRILYIEDDPANFLLVKRALEAGGGVEVVNAPDGESGLKLAAELTPALVLVDLQLPVLDGVEVTRRIKRDEKLAGIPVLVLTANVMAGEKERALAAGCDGFVSKPFNLAAFRQKIKELLGG
jgi:two-component system cell cycle response regulator DivK